MPKSCFQTKTLDFWFRRAIFVSKPDHLHHKQLFNILKQSRLAENLDFRQQGLNLLGPQMMDGLARSSPDFGVLLYLKIYFNDAGLCPCLSINGKNAVNFCQSEMRFSNQTFAQLVLLLSKNGSNFRHFIANFYLHSN